MKAKKARASERASLPISNTMNKRIQILPVVALFALAIEVWRAWRLRRVERELKRAWRESKRRCGFPACERDFLRHLPRERAEYVRARLELDCWAWSNGVPFEPYVEGFGEDLGGVRV